MATQQKGESEDSETLTPGKILDIGKFIIGAIKRRKGLVIGIFTLVTVITVVTFAVMPRTYKVRAKLLARQNLLMPALGNPKRAVPTDADAPTKWASELIMRRENLVSIIKQSNLVDEWDGTRAPILKMKDWCLNLVFGPLKDDEQIEALVGYLEKKLKVTADEGTVTIELEWHEPNTAHRLVDAAQNNFLEGRHAFEVSSIAETIAIIEGYALSVRNQLETTVDEMRKSKIPTASPAPERHATRPPLTAAAAKLNPSSADLAQLRTMFQAKQRAIEDLEDFRHKRLEELQTQLNEQKLVYAPAHPTIQNTTQSIKAMSTDSPQLEQLRREQDQLQKEFARRGGEKEIDSKAEPASTLKPLPAELRELPALAVRGPEEDEMYSYTKARLRIGITKYEDLLDRIDAARIELDTARAAFKYRYSIVQPSQVPRDPESPVAPAFLGGGIFLALMLAVIAAVGSDLFSGRVIESWQVETLLGVPVLMEVPAP